MQNKILRLTESALLIALSTVLSLVPVFTLPMGGTVDLASFVPMLILAYRYGTGWGIFCGTVNGALQMLLGFSNLRYATSFSALAAIILLDYLAAYAVFGLGGLFRGRLKNARYELALGAVLPCVLKFFCHFVTGCTVWGAWAPEEMPVWLYSAVYNSSYMLPDTLITVLVCGILGYSLNFTGERIGRHGPADRG